MVAKTAVKRAKKYHLVLTNPGNVYALQWWSRHWDWNFWKTLLRKSTERALDDDHSKSTVGSKFQGKRLGENAKQKLVGNTSHRLAKEVKCHFRLSNVYVISTP